MQALDILGLDYESEYTDLEYSVDLALPNERIAIEVPDVTMSRPNGIRSLFKAGPGIALVQQLCWNAACRGLCNSSVP